MSATRRTAISYSRFSDPTQAKGDSETRQADQFRNFCERHNLTPLTEVYADKGRSGYKGHHRTKGRLGELIQAAKDKRFEPGTVIVVEAWDRLGRLRPDKQTELVAELLRTGVSIGVCRLDDLFTEDDFGTHKWTTLAVFIQLAYQESKQKAERLAAAWQRRRERARIAGKSVNGPLPAWTERTADGELRLIPERAAAVRRIFELAAAGYGRTRIVASLIREGVPPFGEVRVREHRTRSQFSGRWTKPYVTLILTDRRALGEYQPAKVIEGKPQRSRDRHEGAAIPGYFPAAVTEELFQLARAAEAGRKGHRDVPKRPEVPGGPDGPRRAGRGGYVNAFRGLLVHARDQEGFVLQNKGTTARPLLTLTNAAGEGGRGESVTFPYPVFEQAILSRLQEVRAEDVLPAADANPGRADLLRARLANCRADLAGLQADLQVAYSKALADVLRAKEAEEQAIADSLQDELARSARPAATAWGDVPGLCDLLRDAADPDPIRLRLRGVLRNCIESIWVLIQPRGVTKLCYAQVNFRGEPFTQVEPSTGDEFLREPYRAYIIIHKQAGRGRRGGWASIAVKQPEMLRQGWPLEMTDLKNRGPVDDVQAAEQAMLAYPIDIMERLLAAHAGMASGG
jgi:DNA invertase Pin-like site-specific DNA recombinase